MRKFMSPVVESFVHPVTKKILKKDSHGNLFEEDDSGRLVFTNYDGTYDFVFGENTNEEKEYYNQKYSQENKNLYHITIKDLQKAWKSEPGFEFLLKSMGNIDGKKVLLLGAGISLKELHFLYLGAQCVYTDLSINACKYIKNIFNSSELKKDYSGQIEFHAVNACNLPFHDRSFDIIYGCVFIHHIDDLDSLFSEVYRCLKSGGICRFLDGAYSSLWQSLKNTVLKPVQIYSHRKHGISPEDLRDTKRGGYTKQELEKIMRTHNFQDILFERMSFFEYLLWRGTLKLGGRFLRVGMPVLKSLDEFLARRTNFIKTQGIRLIWGFSK